MRIQRNDSRQLASDFIKWVNTVSGGRVNYEIGETQIITGADAYIPQENGIRFNEQELLECVADSACADAIRADYSWIVMTYDIVNKVNRRQVDEVWMFGPPGGGFNESRPCQIK